jgi:hypothetical protein
VLQKPAQRSRESRGVGRKVREERSERGFPRKMEND